MSYAPHEEGLPVNDVELGVDGSFSEKVEYALGELADALDESGASTALSEEMDVDVAAGTPDASEYVADLQHEGKLDVPDADESLVVSRIDDTLVVAGSDERGLMYGLLEVAEQVRIGGRTLDEIDEIRETPDTEFRGVYTFLHNQDCDEQWFHSKEHWQEYFDLLAKSRYNSFHIVMGHQTNYLSPPFPFFVDVEAHPEVSVPELDEERRQRNLEMLDYISTLAEKRGIDFVLGVWQVIAWRPETRHAGRVQESLVDGLDWDNLESYTYHGLKTLLEECPAIKGIQLRANAESGVPEDRQTEFFTDTVFGVLEDVDREIYLDLRGWGTRDATIDVANEMDFPMRLSMKYWAEHLGGPYQAPDQLPSYSFADFLRYPREFPVSYQVWTLGSHRIFIWGDPEYARTFADTLDLGDGIGFEICPQLAQKGYGNEPGGWRLLNDEYEYYTWEYERYWLFYSLFGRLSYNADADSAVWMRQMRARFGDLAEDVMDAYSTASRILTFIIRFNMSDPNMYIFPEADTGGVLDYYLDVQPSDPALINSFRESVREQLTGEFTARLDPEEASEYLRTLGRECLDAVDELEAAADDENGELRSTLVDVESLAELALYHAEKILAAKSLTAFYENDDFAALHESAEQLKAATPHWKRLVDATNGVYNDHLVTGPVDNVTWDEKLQLVEEDVERLEEQRRLHREYGGYERAFDFGGSYDFDMREVLDYLNRTYEYEKPWLHDFYVERGFTGVDDACTYGRTDDYGWEDPDGLSARRAPRVRLGDKHLDSLRRDSGEPTGWEDLEAYENELYADHVAGSAPATFTTSISPGEYEVIVIAADRSEDPTDHGPMSVTIDGDEVASDVTVPAGEVTDLSSRVELDRDHLSVTFSASEDADWIVAGLVVRPIAPRIVHTPERTTDPDEDTEIIATVTCPDALDEVSLCVRPHDGTVRRIPMTNDDEETIYRAEIPEELVQPNVSLDYWFEAASTADRTARLPERTDADQTFELRPAVSDVDPRIDHEPIQDAQPGESIRIEATVESGLPLESVRLHYRYTNQYYEYETVEMERVRRTDDGGGEAVYVATIPGDYVVPEWDLMYYLEAVDEAGSGNFAPQSDPRENSVRTVPYNVIAVNR